MSLFVMEFASKDIKHLINTIDSILQGLNINIEVLFTDEAEEFCFNNWSDSLYIALQGLHSDAISAVQVTTDNNQLELMTIYSPTFGKIESNDFYCVCDFNTTLKNIELLSNNLIVHATNLSYLSVSIEESLDLSELAFVDDNSFPWQDWKMVIATLQGKNFKKGKAYDRLAVSLSVPSTNG